MNRVDSIKFKGNFVVFKPKNEQDSKKQQLIQPKIQPKYKRPKQELKTKCKNSENDKK